MNRTFDPRRPSAPVSPREKRSIRGGLVLAAMATLAALFAAIAPQPSAGALNGCAVQRITNLSPGGDSSLFNDSVYPFRGKLFFSGDDDGDIGNEPYFWDGSKVRLLKNVMPSRFFSSFPDFRANTATRLFFTARGSNRTGTELWVTNGTTGGTRLVKDLTPGSGSTFFSEFTVAGNRIFFTARDHIGDALFVSDGTRVGTRVVRRFVSGTRPRQLVGFKNRVYFPFRDSVAGEELWVSGGTAASTRRFVDLFPGTSSSSPTIARAHKGLLYFSGRRSFNDGTADLWVTDGTIAGTRGVKDLRPGTIGVGRIESSVVVGGNLHLWINDGNAVDLWVSNGTKRGTRMVGNLNIDSINFSTPDQYQPRTAAAQGWVFYQDTRARTGREWWAWKNGQRKLVTGIAPGVGDSSARWAPIVAYKGSVYMAATNARQGKELWRMRCPA